MKNVFIAALFFWATISQAQSWLEVEKLFIDGKSFTGRSNDSVNEAIGRKLDKSLTLGLDINFLNFMFFNNRVDGRSGCIDEKQCQFSEISYNFVVGASIFPNLDISYGHTSTHALDNNYGYDVEDYIGFRLYLIKPGENKSLFP